MARSSDADSPEKQMEDLFGELGESKAPARGRDLAIDLTLTPREALSGLKRKLSLTRRVLCEACAGSGRDPAAPECNTCGGKGRVTRTHDNNDLMVTTPCEKCKGRGHDERYDCGACSGGLIAQTTHINVVVPPHGQDGMQLRITGKGDDTRDGQRGDVYVKLKIEGPSVSDGSAYRGATPESLRAEDALSTTIAAQRDAHGAAFRFTPLLVGAGIVVVVVVLFLLYGD